MQFANNIVITVFAKEEEDAASIEEGLKRLVGIDMEAEKIVIKKNTALGFNERKIKIMEVFINKNRQINLFLKNFVTKLNQEQKDLLIKQSESRLDEDFNFFVRLDKTRFIADEYWITDQGNCYHIKMNIACFPRKRENALSVIKQIFK